MSRRLSSAAVVVIVAVVALAIASAAAGHPVRHRTNVKTWSFQIDLPTGFEPGLKNGAVHWDNVSLQCHDFAVQPRGVNVDHLWDRYWIDGGGGIYAEQNDAHSSTVLDSGETWHQNINTYPTPAGLDLWSVAAHEFGHALSIEHLSHPNTMYAYFNYGDFYFRDADGGDVAAIRQLYPPGTC